MYISKLPAPVESIITFCIHYRFRPNLTCTFSLSSCDCLPRLTSNKTVAHKVVLSPSHRHFFLGLALHSRIVVCACAPRSVPESLSILAFVHTLSFPLLLLSLSFCNLSKLHRPAIGLCQLVATALRADNAWRSANGHPLAWDVLSSTSGSSTDAPQPRVTFALKLAHGSPATRTITLAETLDRWCTDANAGEGVSYAFASVIGSKWWHAE